MVWKRAILAGKSSPVLTDSKIFLTAGDGGDLTVLCLDRATGKTLWQRSIRESRHEFQNQLNSPASPTPATDGKNVYAFFGNYGLISYDGDGNERWRTPLGPFSSLWGMASSPVLVNGNVVQLLDAFGESYIAAFDQATGKKQWQTDRQPFALNYSTPVVRMIAGGDPEIWTVGSRQMVGYDARTGAVRWSADTPGGSMVASPGLDQNIILSLSNSLETIPSFDEQLKNLDKNGDGRLTPDEFGTDENARVLETFGGLYGNRNGIVEREEWAQVWQQWVGRPAATAVRVVATKNGGIETEKAWSYFRNVPRVSSPILYQGVAYLLANGGILTALDAKTGTLLKSGRLHRSSRQLFRISCCVVRHVISHERDGQNRGCESRG